MRAAAGVSLDYFRALLTMSEIGLDKFRALLTMSEIGLDKFRALLTMSGIGLDKFRALLTMSGAGFQHGRESARDHPKCSRVSLERCAWPCKMSPEQVQSLRAAT